MTVFDDVVAAAREGRAFEDQALHAAFDHLQALHASADTVPAFTFAYQGARKIAPIARDRLVRPMAFRIRVLAAECAFRIADLTEHSPNWLVASLHELHKAAAEAIVPVDPPSLAMYVNVAPNLVGPSLAASWGSYEAQATDLVCSVADETERLVPVDYVHPSRPAVTAFVAEQLALLSEQCGNPAVGAARRAFLSRLA